MMPAAPPSPTVLPSLDDQISADPVPNSTPNNGTNNKEHHFLSRCLPGRMGQVAPIAYGGGVIALAVHAAHQTLPPNSPKPYNLYSILGTFHSGAKTDRKLHLTVTPTRDTRTFATRRVVGYQPQDDNTIRTCIEVTIDFHIEEPTFVKWDAQPDLPEVLTAGPVDPKRTSATPKILADYVSQGLVTEKEAKAFTFMFREAEHHLEMRHAFPSVSGLNLYGLVPRLPTPQDHLPITKRTSYEWFRIRPKYTPATSSPFHKSSTNSEALNKTALAFIMDQALSFLPLNHDHKGFPDSSACSTLEFALRVFLPKVWMEEWHLRERKTVSAGVGRTFSEAKVWTENGELVCNMSQSCILRGAVKKERKGGEKEGGKSKM